MPEPIQHFTRKQLQFTANIREPLRYPAPPDVSPDRMAIYHDLIYNTIHAIISKAFPVCKSMYSETEWAEITRDFLAKHKSKCPTRQDLPEEFLHYLSYVRQNPGDPTWFYELAHYEWLEYSLDASPMSLADVPHNFDGNLLNEIPVISPLAWSQVYRHPVHTIKPGYQDEVDTDQPTYLVVYRNWQDKVEYLQVNDYTHALIQLLNQETSPLTGREALTQLISLSEHPHPPTVIQSGALLLEDLREKHVIMGTKPCDPENNRGRRQRFQP